MTQTVKKKGRLFYKFLFIFLIVSLVPLGIVGYYIVNLSRLTLNKAILIDQESLSVSFAATIYNYVMSFRNVLSEVAHLEDIATMNIPKQQAIINHFMQLHAAFLEISVIDARGLETVRISRFQHDNRLRNFADNPIFLKIIKNGEFIGGIERLRGSPTLTIGVQIISPVSHQPVGAIVAKFTLSGLSAMLKTGFPESTHTQAAVIDSNGFLVAHSNPEEIFSKPNPKLPDDVLKILLQNDAKTGGGEILMRTGERVLGAFSEVVELGWVVYIQRSISFAYQASNELLKRTYKMMAIVIGFVLFLGYAVSIIITQPIQALREAAVKLGQGDFDYLPDLRMPNDEIGELAHTFMQMSESLKVKTAEIISAKEELEKLNRNLENRVEARTRELKSAQDELIKKERLAAIGQMASVVGHEIRNPLAVIKNSVYYINARLTATSNPDPKIIKHISIIESEIQQANGIINEILGFARTKELNLKPQRLNTYLEDLMTSFPFPPHIQVIKEFATENPVVNIDVDEMTQAVRNLIRNAIEVMPEHGTLKIKTEVDSNGFVKLQVEDTGPGIPKDILDKIFTPFFTTKARGTGLGLAVVKKVIDRHKGKVEVFTQSGKGTTFKLSIPILESQHL